MRPLEVSFISINLIVLAISFIRKGAWDTWLSLLSFLAFGLGVAQIWMEGARWQMYPAYAVAVTLTLAGASGYLNSRRQSIDLLAAAPRATRQSKLVLLRNIIGIALLLSAVVLGSLFPIFSFPDPGGPDAIGTVTREWVRTAFNEDEQLGSQPSRKLTVQFWYPAVRDPEAKVAPYRDGNSGRLLAHYLHLVPTHAQMNVPVATAQRTFPVILFSPMWNSGRTQNTFEFEMLASHGFVVASIEHPQDDLQEVISYSDAESLRQKDLEILRRARDIQFVLDQLEKINDADPENFLTGRLDLSRVGITGHSFGGSAAAESCWLDPRIRAGINMDGTLFGKVGDVGALQPFFFMFSDGPVYPSAAALNSTDPGTRYQAQIDFRDAKRDEAWLNRHGGYRIIIRGASHLNYTDKPMFSPLKQLTAGGSINPWRAMQIVNAYTLAFFEKHLNNRPEPLLDGPTSLYPEVEFEAYPPPDQHPPTQNPR